MSAGSSNLEQSVSLTRREPLHCPTARFDPRSQGITSEILVDNQDCSALIRQPWNPCREYFVKCPLADLDRGIAPDHVESNLVGHVCRSTDFDISEPESCRIGGGELSGAFVDVHCPDTSRWSTQRHRDRNWSNTTSEVEELSVLGKCWRLQKENLGTRVESPASEHT